MRAWFGHHCAHGAGVSQRPQAPCEGGWAFLTSFFVVSSLSVYFHGSSLLGFNDDLVSHTTIPTIISP